MGGGGDVTEQLCVLIRPQVTVFFYEFFEVAVRRRGSIVTTAVAISTSWFRGRDGAASNVRFEELKGGDTDASIQLLDHLIYFKQTCFNLTERFFVQGRTSHYLLVIMFELATARTHIASHQSGHYPVAHLFRSANAGQGR